MVSVHCTDWSFDISVNAKFMLTAHILKIAAIKCDDDEQATKVITGLNVIT